jgi:serine/threonine protein kinase
MAEVFLAQDTSVAGMERLVVIKRVLPHLARQPKFIAMFLDEARLTARLTHPNIAQLYEVGQDDGNHFVVIEFIHGADVSTVLKKGAKSSPRLDASLVALICSRVAAALHYAHTLKDLAGQLLHVVHRDISPQNIRITYDGVPKVIDFGIAKSVGKLETTQSGVLKGKYGYMSPEQLRGEALDGRSDIFSLGVVMYELLSYKRLFRRDSAAASMHAILNDRVSPLADCGCDVPQELEEIVMRALERDPDARYPSAREMLLDLDQFSRQHPASAVDLERFMTETFGDPALARRDLALAIEKGDLARVFETGSSRSSALSSARGAQTAATATVGAAHGALSAGQSSVSAHSLLHYTTHPGARRRSYLIGAGVVVLLLVSVSLLVWAPWSAERGEPSVPGEGIASAGGVSAAAGPSDQRSAAETEGQAELAKILLNTTPPAAEVLINGQPTGKTTPTVLSDIPPGEHVVIELRLEGYVTQRRIFKLGSAEEQHYEHVFVRLPARASTMSESNDRPAIEGRSVGRRTSRRKSEGSTRRAERSKQRARAAFGYLTIDTKPWSKVFVDGKQIGITPVADYRLPAGAHRLTLRAGEIRRDLTIDIAPGAHVRRTLVLER